MLLFSSTNGCQEQEDAFSFWSIGFVYSFVVVCSCSSVFWTSPVVQSSIQSFSLASPVESTLSSRWMESRTALNVKVFLHFLQYSDVKTNSGSISFPCIPSNGWRVFPSQNIPSLFNFGHVHYSSKGWRYRT